MPREMILCPYDPQWPERFEQIKEELLMIFGDLALDIQHFGSTAIVGMDAKPIIDVMVIVSDIAKVDDVNPQMEQAGYRPKGENGMPGRRYFQKFHSDGVNHTRHIHCYERDNPAAIDELMFRDYLHIDAEAFEAYRSVKREASARFRHSPVEYTDFKTDCITGIMKKAKEYYAK